MSLGIDAEMQLTPPAARPETTLLIQPFALAVDLQAGAVDKKVQRLVAIDPFRQDRQAAAAATQSRMVGDSDVDPKRAGDRSQHAFGLPQRLMKHQAKREACL